jgi:hypothetical protein
MRFESVVSLLLQDGHTFRLEIDDNLHALSYNDQYARMLLSVMLQLKVLQLQANYMTCMNMR